jgi:hypothetical protein
VEGFSRRGVGYPLQLADKVDATVRADLPLDLPGKPMQEKAYGLDGFTCGNDRTLSEKASQFPRRGGEQAAETLSFSRLGRVTKSFGIGVAISPGTRSSEALQGEIGK